MKSLFKKVLCASMVLLVAAGCSDDIAKEFNPTGTVEDENGELISVFNLCTDRDLELTGTHTVTFHVSSLALDSDYSFSGTISSERGITINGCDLTLRCRLNLRDIQIPNGDYYISISGENLPNLGSHKVRFLDNTVTEVEREAFRYEGLKGNGSKENPYIISSANDFNTMITHLRNDPDHGYGIYFKQTEDISLGYKADEELIATAPFQGIYDGGGHSLTSIYWKKPYSGYSDICVGLFTTLSNATIANLTISDARFSGVAGRGGILAGNSIGQLTLENLSITGVMQGNGKCIGGVIGDVQGGVTISNVTVEKETIVEDRNIYAGGLFGSLITSAESTLKGIRCFALIEGDEYAGGIIGSAKGSKKLSFDDIVMDGNVDGSFHVGGVFGYLENASINNITVGETGVMYVKGKENVGGIVGSMINATLSDSQSFDFERNEAGTLVIPNPERFKSSYSGRVLGNKNVGGIAGSAKNSKFLHISSSATVECEGEQIGGIAGYVEDTENVCRIEDCTFTGNIISHFNDYIGGIVGFLRSSNGGHIRDCVNYSSIVGGDYTGGICGYVHKDQSPESAAEKSIEITWAVNAGDIQGKNNVAGIIGRVYFKKLETYLLCEYEIEITNCMNAGEVIALGGDGEDGLGGIVGRSSLATHIYLCANHGKIEALGKLHAVGGIIGRMGQDAAYEREDNMNTRVFECINTAPINSTHRHARVGGITGYGEEGGSSTGISAGVWDSLNTGVIMPDQDDDTGGIMGCSDSYTVIKGNINLGKVEHGNAILGTHKFMSLNYEAVNYFIEGTGGSWPSWLAHGIPQSKLTDQSAYQGFDFKTIWEMTSEGPNLRRNKWRDPASAGN